MGGGGMLRRNARSRHSSRDPKSGQVEWIRTHSSECWRWEWRTRDDNLLIYQSDGSLISISHNDGTLIKLVRSLTPMARSVCLLIEL